MSTPSLIARVDACLHTRFALTTFRGLQKSVILRVLAGKDVLALMPTGAGKSLCYQLPAVLLPGLTLVVSPLLALMRDQQRRLCSLSIPSVALTGPFDQARRCALGTQLAAGALKVLLLSPERLLASGFLDWLHACLGPAGVSLLVVDEAHCIVDWGDSFRPIYRQLGSLRPLFPHVPVLALTASADLRVRTSILNTLGMPADAILVSSFDRPELFYRVARSSAPWRHAVAYLQAYHAADSAIFYCQRRRETELLAYFLRQQGIVAHYYHAGRSPQQRMWVERWFCSKQDAVIAATIAFGLGVDKPDVRLVVHRGLARDLPAYYQETGRAGRDGKDADALLLMDASPFKAGFRHSAAVLPTHASPRPVSDRDRTQTVSPAQLPTMLERFATANLCRRMSLLQAFGEAYSPPCGRCDHCAPRYRPLPSLRISRAQWVRTRETR